MEDGIFTNGSNSVDHDKCVKCKLCIEVCPVKMIGIDQDGFVNFIKERESICLECGQCMAVCTTDAIKTSYYTYENNFKKSSRPIEYEEFTDFLASRRSVRNFKDKAVDKHIIEKILDSLNYAPYGAEPDKVEVTVINNREIIEQILPHAEKFLDDIIKWVDNPFISRIIKFKAGIETFNTIKNHLYPMSKLENYKLKYGDAITRGAPALMVFHAEKGSAEHTDNALIYATYAMLAIHSSGLGGAMNGIIPAAVNKVKEIKEIFKIPDEHEAVISIMFGYPRYKYKKSIIRKRKKINWIE